MSVVPEVFLSACVEDCGTYGECRLLRSYTYLYAACVCKAGRTHAQASLCPLCDPLFASWRRLPAGWRGWGCTDASTAQSFSRQLAAALLLTLSNLSFLPAIVVAILRCYITEASVYIFTMFFSTVTHPVLPCDQQEASVSLKEPFFSLFLLLFFSSTMRAISQASR